MNELRERLEVACALARQAGRLVMEVYAQDFAVAFKGAEDPVTKADMIANDHIVQNLRKHFPQDGIVAEESADHDDRSRFEDCWFVDPLDGTKEFIAKNGEFSVMIGFARRGKAVLGVVAQPVSDRMYAGLVGEEAFVLEGERRSPMHVSEVADPASLRLVVSRSHRSSEVDRLKEALGIRSEAASGSVGLKIGLIATRQADLYVHFSDRSSLWDACAPEAVLVAAGGQLTGCDGVPMDYRKALRTERGIFASNGVVHERVLPYVRRIAPFANS